MWLGAIVTIVLGVGGLADQGTQPDSPMALSTLLKAFYGNELAANAQYKGRTLTITAIAIAVHADPPVLGLQDAQLAFWEGSTIRTVAGCELASSAISDASQLQMNRKVTVRGRVLGLVKDEGVRALAIGDCVIVRESVGARSADTGSASDASAPTRPAGASPSMATSSSSAPVCADASTCTSAGRAALEAGRSNDAIESWVKVLQFGGTLNLPVYQKRTLGCDGGTLTLGDDGEVSLADYRSRPVFKGMTATTGCKGPWRGVGFTLEVEGKKYNLVYVPRGKPENTATAIPEFDAMGQSAQRAVAEFVCKTVGGGKTGQQ